MMYFYYYELQKDLLNVYIDIFRVMFYYIYLVIFFTNLLIASISNF